ncbi:hypothetical protein HBHAL_1456 [Halobacillus halophilus DSM 2266]|uniref:Uncharacterized protein n=1 Tax=Halobacillus halophilus (strain ATCC 35676 / DSM 2266 / JCM 20832 / KCTC 3685 / LMG 17431 / NBRC 102448 / NCIMB 2269) TaxID=866895 RepID=I0JI60_HALH3|nr:hypothetical protein HBHAL_1456 [Halobacillus halophilus DSM 2266]
MDKAIEKTIHQNGGLSFSLSADDQLVYEEESAIKNL